MGWRCFESEWMDGSGGFAVAMGGTRAGWDE